MSLTIPTTQEITDDIVAQLATNLSTSVPLLPKSFTRVVAKVFAGSVVILYKYAGFMQLQCFPAFATINETTINGKRIRPLVEWGRLIGESDPVLAQRAEMTVAVTVTNQTGTIAAGTQLLRSDTSIVYQVIAPVPLNAPTIQVRIRAASDPSGNGGAGAIGNLSPGDTVSFASTPANVGPDAIVLTLDVAGIDGESADAYRARIMRRFQQRPKGGAFSHFVDWAMEVPSIRDVYPYVGHPGEVDVYVEASDTTDGIPTTAQLTAVSNAIEFDANGLRTRRPAGTLVNVLPISLSSFNVGVFALSPNTPEIQTAISEGLDEYFRSREPFIAGVTSTSIRQDLVTQAGVSGVVDTIAIAAGASVARVEVSEGVIPIDSRQLRPGEKARLGTPTYTTGSA